jgi:hypothetical protein
VEGASHIIIIITRRKHTASYNSEARKGRNGEVRIWATPCKGRTPDGHKNTANHRYRWLYVIWEPKLQRMAYAISGSSAMVGR